MTIDTGTTALHLGMLQLEHGDDNYETGTIDEHVLLAEKEFKKFLSELLQRLGLSNEPKLMATLYGTGWLKLDAPTCLRLGLVGEVFGPTAPEAQPDGISTAGGKPETTSVTDMEQLPFS